MCITYKTYRLLASPFARAFIMLCILTLRDILIALETLRKWKQLSALDFAKRSAFASDQSTCTVLSTQLTHRKMQKNAKTNTMAQSLKDERKVSSLLSVWILITKLASAIPGFTRNYWISHISATRGNKWA